MNKLFKKFSHRDDFSLIAQWINPQSRVLDLGCGNGELLYLLSKNKKVFPMGINIDQDEIAECISKGVPVVQQDLNQGLSNFKDHSFDYVLLSQTLQVMHHPDLIIKEMLRVGKFGIVSFPNFGHYKIRLGLLFNGRMPKSKFLPYNWYNTPNIHLLTIKDFRNFCSQNQIKILKEYHIYSCLWSPFRLFPNLFSEGSIVLISY